VWLARWLYKEKLDTKDGIIASLKGQSEVGLRNGVLSILGSQCGLRSVNLAVVQHGSRLDNGAHSGRRFDQGIPDHATPLGPYAAERRFAELAEDELRAAVSSDRI